MEIIVGKNRNGGTGTCKVSFDPCIGLFHDLVISKRLAKWLRSFGEGWLEQPEIHQELARRLGLLGRVATGELAEVAKSLSERLSCVEEKENQKTNKPSNQPMEESESNEQGIMPLLNQAVQQLQSQNYQGALDSSVKATKIYPHDSRGWNLRGIALRDLGRNQEALASYDQALKLQPDDYQAWHNRGILVRRLSTYNGYYQQQFVELFYLDLFRRHSTL